MIKPLAGALQHFYEKNEYAKVDWARNLIFFLGQLTLLRSLSRFFWAWFQWRTTRKALLKFQNSTMHAIYMWCGPSRIERRVKNLDSFFLPAFGKFIFFCCCQQHRLSSCYERSLWRGRLRGKTRRAVSSQSSRPYWKNIWRKYATQWGKLYPIHSRAE